jgi:ribosomal protein L23
LAAWLVLSLVVAPIYGQSELGTVMKKHYSLRSVSCNTCHIKEQEEKSKDQLTPFGQVVAKLVEGQKITERLNAVKDMEEEKELVKEAIEKEFAETVKKLDAVKDPSGKTYAELIQAGEIDGLKPRK